MFKYALRIILKRKMRTFLTSLGITIAIVLVSFIIFGMNDLKSLLVGQFTSQFKPNQTIISRSTTGMLTMLGEDEKESKDKVVLSKTVVNELKNNPNIEKVQAMLLVSGMQLRLDGEEDSPSSSFVYGWDIRADDPYFNSYTGNKVSLEKGEIFVTKYFVDFYNLKAEDIVNKYVYLETSPYSFFSTKSASTLNKKFKFKIVGVLDTAKERLDALLSTDDALKVLASVGGFETKAEYLKEIGYDEIMIDVKEGKMDTVEKEIKEKYGYNPISSKDLLGFLESITNGLTVGLVMFALVSAVVASIGIINTMTMSIHEQTKEIGIIKAIGASNFQVLLIFLIQSGIIGLIGGVFGLTIVYSAMKLLDPFVVAELVKAGFIIDNFFSFNPTTAIIIALASMCLGIIAGVYPAFKASNLDPVKALRYE